MAYTRFLFALITLALSSAGKAADTGTWPAPVMRQSGSSADFDSGVKAVRTGDYTRAVALLQKVVDADPRNADAWNYIGYSQRKLQHYDQSLTAYKIALDLSPDHLGANEYLGELYLAMGDVDKARERLAKVQSLCPRGCEEYEDLKKAIATYPVAQKAN